MGDISVNKTEIIDANLYEYKQVLLDYILCGCHPRFLFLSESLVFTPNPGLYKPMSPCSLLKWPYFYSDVLLCVSTLHSCTVCPLWGVGGMKIEEGVDLIGLVCAGVSDAVLAQNIYFSSPNTEPDSHSGSWFHNGFGSQSLWSTL